MNTYSKPSKYPQAIFRFILSIILLTISIFGFSQNVKNRMVYVSDAQSQPISGVKIKVDFSKKTIEGVTDGEGILRFEILDDSTYNQAKVSIRNNFYAPIDTIVDFSCTTPPQIILTPIALDEVNVVGYRKFSQKNAEKTTFIINTKGLLKTAKANIALRRVPSVVYADGVYYLIGKHKKAKVLVNGLEVSEEELSKIDAKDIAKVELYQIGLNDDQHSGEIRILLKKNLSTLYKGEVEASTNLLYLGNSFTPSFTYRSKKIDWISWLSYAHGDQESQYRINRDNKEVYHSINHNKIQQYSASSKLNILFSPKWMSTLSYSFWGYSSPMEASWEFEGITQPSKQAKESYYSNFANLILRHDLSTNKRLFLKARYFNYKSENSSSLDITKFIGRMNEFTSDILYELDSLSLFTKWHSFVVGYKSIYRHSTLTSSNKVYNSYVQQFYAKDNFTLNENWDFFVLLRSEWDRYRFEKGRNFKKFAFLPTISLNYKSGVGNISAIYERGIERPNIDYLNPDIYYMNDITQYKGNPNLESQFTDKYSITYNRQIKNSYLTADASFSSVNNLIEQIYLNNYNTSIYENIGNSQTFKFDLAYNKPLFSNALNINLGVGVGYTMFRIASKFSEKTLNKEHQGWFFMGAMNLSYMMPKDWFVNFSMNYLNKDIRLNAIYYKNPTFNFLLTKSLLQNKLDISLEYIDMFGISKKQRVEYCFKDMKQISTYSLPTSMLYISLTYRFGKQFRSRSIGNTITNEDITTK